MATKHWQPGELERLKAFISEEGDGDELCDCCDRYISAHDADVEFCSPSARRPEIRPLTQRDPLVVMASQRISATKAGHVYYRCTRLSAMRRTLDYLAQREMDLAAVRAFADLRWAA